MRFRVELDSREVEILVFKSFKGTVIHIGV